MAEYQCFYMEPTENVERWLRRYVQVSQERGDEPCPKNLGRYGHHQAQARIANGMALRDANGCLYTDPMEWPHDDPRWPSMCGCGYQFTDDDPWQLWYDQIYVDRDAGKFHSLRTAPVGAMWNSDWIGFKGIDGRSLSVRTPGGDWHIDMPSTGSGAHWQRTGDPPRVTAMPSILIGTGVNQYHGWLRDGVLVDA